jgi:hypothetical protein
MDLEYKINKANVVLPYLIECAKKKETITYTDLGKKDKVKMAASDLGPILAYIRDELCIKNNKPIITALVVQKNTRGKNYILPGESWLPSQEKNILDSIKKLDSSTGKELFEDVTYLIHNYVKEWVFTYDGWDDFQKSIGL